MNNLETKLATLEALANEQEAKLSKGIRNAIITYMILALVVFGYTLFVGNKLIELTSPQVVKEQFMAYINQVPQQRQALYDTYKKNSDAWAKALVSNVIDSMPLLENQIQALLTQYTDALARQVETEILPSFTAYLKAEAPEIQAKYKDLTDKDVAIGMANIFVDIIETEMDKYINKELVDDLNKLQVQLQELAKPNASLTQRQDAQRRVIQYWVFLTEHTPVGESVFNGFMPVIKEQVAKIFPFVAKLKVADTELTDKDVEEMKKENAAP